MQYLPISSISLFILLSCFCVNGQHQPKSPLIESFKDHEVMKKNTELGFEWIQIGPTLNGARVEAVQGDPKNPGTIYTAFGSGGLWKSENNGLHWIPIFENKPSLGIGDFALAPSNGNIIYLGTGESLKKARNFTMPGTGMYKSVDGGANWVHIGLNDSWHIGEIAVHPTNPDIVVVAVLGHFWSTNENRGVFRTIDGGKTWEKVLFVDNQTGANDVVFSFADPKIVFASTWENNPGVSGRKSAIYRSADSGKTWSKVVNGIHVDENTGRIGLAASFQNKNVAYAFIDQRNRENGIGAGEIYKTIDGGENWTKTHEGGLENLSVIGWYFMDLYVNPLHDSELYALGVQLAHSNDSGASFNYLSGPIRHLNPSPAQTLHLDHCEMWINPINPNELLLGNDGGLFHSYDNGESWLHLNNMPTGEFYDISLGPGDPYTIYGGVQDNATVFGPGKEFNPNLNDSWQYLWIDAWSGGDGCITLIDPNDSNTIYFSMQNGAAMRRNVAADTSVSIRPVIDGIAEHEIQYNFITPYMLYPQNSNHLLMAGNYLMKSENRGDNWDTISPNFLKVKKKHPLEHAAGALDISTFDENVIYVGTDRGSFWVSKTGGENWEESSKGLGTNYIRSIKASTHKFGRVYLQLTGINYDDLSAYLYCSEDHGETWEPIMGDIPNMCINMIYEDPFYEDLLYAGTYRGVYISKNRGRNWSYLGNNMPDASISDIEIDSNTKDLIVSTHGRGIYKLNLNAYYQTIHNQEIEEGMHLVHPAKEPLYRDTHRDVDEASLEKVNFIFYLQQASVTELTVFDKAGNELWTKEISGKKGFNEYRWDMVVLEETSANPYFIHKRRYMKSGSYYVELQTERGKSKMQFKIANNR